MEFIAEDGTGLELANSLVTVAYADAYFELRGNQTWLNLTPETKQILLIKATDYIGIRFKFKDELLNPLQALPFPRKGLGIPNDVKKACCEYAIRAKDADLAPDLEQDASGMMLASKTEKVGPIEESYSFASTSKTDIQLFKRFPSVDALMFRYVKARSGRSYR